MQRIERLSPGHKLKAMYERFFNTSHFKKQNGNATFRKPIKFGHSIFRNHLLLISSLQ